MAKILQSWNRRLSLLVVVVYLIIGATHGGGEVAFNYGLFVFFPLACIWFGEAMGGYIGPVWRGNITEPSPGIIVCILGWVLLLIPLLLALLQLKSSKS